MDHHHHLNPITSLKPEGDKNNKVPRKNKGGSGPPDGDDEGGDDPDDDDEKFRRRMIKFFGGFVVTKRMMTSPKSRRLTQSRSQRFLWQKPIVIGESKQEKQL